MIRQQAKYATLMRDPPEEGPKLAVMALPEVVELRMARGLLLSSVPAEVTI
jgi:hypothetical protein